MSTATTQPVVIVGRTSTGKRRTFSVRSTATGTVALDMRKSTAGAMDFIHLDVEAAEQFGAKLLRAARESKAVRS